jgi:TonB family protein
MAPIAKENEILSATPEAAVRPNAAASTGNDAGKVQPVALEVPVSVNGARPVDGSDKREPFSETTKTVLIFGNGAVIRLQSPVASGQLLFLTNERTKKEVVCQVVKSKNYRNVSGYVELEFTEPVVGFWGMRFPGDRIGSQSATSGSVAPTPSPTASMNRPATPVAGSPVPSTPVTSTAKPEPVTTPVKPLVSPTSAKPDAAANFNALKSILSGDSGMQLPAPIDAKPAGPPVAQSTPAATSSVAPVGPPAPVKPVVAGDPATEELKQQTARLQEQLSSMLFSEPAVTAAPATPAKPTEPKSPLQELGGTAAKILDFARPPAVEPPAGIQAPKQTAPAKPASTPGEEVKIPSWLEPLARNAANAPVATAPAPVEDTPKRATEVLEPLAEPQTAPETVSPLPLTIDESAPATFGGALLDQGLESRTAGGSRKGLVIGAIAAALVVAGVGTWYLRGQDESAGTAKGTTTAAVSSQTATVNSSAPISNVPVRAPGVNLSPELRVPAADLALPTNPERNAGAPSGKNGSSAPGSKTASKTEVQNVSAVSSEKREVAVEEPKKPLLGQVKLAAPKVARASKAQLGAVSDPGIAMEDNTTGDALSGMIPENTNQPAAPAAPVPVGGDVKPAKLMASVAPTYPALARSQHVGGDVKVDALIDANGRVTTMKIVSGPTLLHQAAMDALRQWKYQPATLDGKPVPMHLTVTIQFRLQ